MNDIFSNHINSTPIEILRAVEDCNIKFFLVGVRDNKIKPGPSLLIIINYNIVIEKKRYC